MIDQPPEVEALRSLLEAQRATLEALRATMEAQTALINQLYQQVERANQQTEDTRADLVEQLATARAQVLKIPRWLRALLGIEV